MALEGLAFFLTCRVLNPAMDRSEDRQVEHRIGGTSFGGVNILPPRAYSSTYDLAPGVAPIEPRDEAILTPLFIVE